jgi:signal transduction histidine kinase
MPEIAELIVKKYMGKAESKRVKLKLKNGPNLPRAMGDPSSLERAVTALVDNAIKFSAHGGEVEIRLAEQAGRILLSVQDHGIGIDPQIRPRIFDRFFHLEKSGDELYGGLGIGLSITRQVIQQHKGSLDVESTPGKGSKFTISLLKWN